MDEVRRRCRPIAALLLACTAVWMTIDPPAQAEDPPWFTTETVDDSFLGSFATTHVTNEFSDDGRVLLTAHSGKSVLTDVATGATTALPQIRDESGFSTRFLALDQLSSSGNHVWGWNFYVRSDPMTTLYDVGSGAVTSLDEIEGVSTDDLGGLLDVSPDGEELLFLSIDEDGVASPVIIDRVAGQRTDSTVSMGGDSTVELARASSDWSTFWFVERNSSLNVKRVVKWNRVTQAEDALSPSQPFGWSMTERPLTFTTSTELVVVDPNTMTASAVDGYDGPLTRFVWTTTSDRVFFTDTPSVPGSSAQNLYAWSPGAERRVVNQSIDGKPTTSKWFGNHVDVSPDGRTAAFTSASANLVAGVDHRNMATYIVRFSSDDPSPGPPTGIPVWPAPFQGTIEEVDNQGSEIWGSTISADGGTHWVITQARSIIVDADGSTRTLPPIRNFEGLGQYARGSLSRSGNHIHYFDSDTGTVDLQDTTTGEVTTVELPDLVPNEDSDLFDIRSIPDISADGRVIAVNTSLQGFLVDAVTGAVLTPGWYGVQPDGAPARSYISAISPDGQVVRYSTVSDGVRTQQVRWDRGSDTRIVVTPPPDNFGTSGWTMTFDADLVVWFTHDGDVRTALRDDLTNSSLVDAPGVATVQDLKIGRNGRVVFSASVPGGRANIVDWYVWDGPGTTARKLVDSSVPDPVRSVGLSEDGTLATVYTTPNDYFYPLDARVYRVELGELAVPSPTTTTTTTTTAPPATSPPTTAPPTTTPPVASPSAPQRIMNTRADAGGQLAPGERRCTAAAGAAAGSFVVVNVTPLRATDSGFGTVHASDAPAGSTSNVNYRAGSTDPNLAVTRVGADGRICFTNSDTDATVDVLMDHVLNVTAAAFTSPTDSGAARIMNTRSSGKGKIGPNLTRCVAAVGAQPGEFVVLNTTPVQATTRGFGTLHPGGTAAGETSNVNFDVATVDPNVAIVQVGADGNVCFTNGPDAEVHVVIDQLLTAPSAAFSNPSADGANRIMNTRRGLGGAAVNAGEMRCVATSNAAPGEFVVLNITPLRATGRGFATVHSSGVDPGDTSDVNYDSGTVDPNVAIVPVGADGTVCYTNGPGASVDVVIDQLLTAPSGVFTVPTAD